MKTIIYTTPARFREAELKFHELISEAQNDNEILQIHKSLHRYDALFKNGNLIKLVTTSENFVRGLKWHAAYIDETIPFEILQQWIFPAQITREWNSDIEDYIEYATKQTIWYF